MLIELRNEDYDVIGFNFVNLADGSSVSCKLPRGYVGSYNDGYSALYAIAENRDTEHNLLYTAEGVLDLGDYSVSKVCQELMIVENRNDYSKLLIDYKGNFVLEGCEHLSHNDTICATDQAVYQLSK